MAPVTSATLPSAQRALPPEFDTAAAAAEEDMTPAIGVGREEEQLEQSEGMTMSPIGTPALCLQILGDSPATVPSRGEVKQRQE